MNIVVDAEEAARDLHELYAEAYVCGQRELLLAARATAKCWPAKEATEFINLFVNVLEKGVDAIEKRYKERQL